MSAIQQVLLAIGGAAGPTDPYFSNVVLLLHMDGANGSTTYVDSSSYARTGTASVDQSTAQFKFGTASADFAAGSVGSKIIYTDAAGWDFGSGQFTIEAWCYWVTHSTTTEQDIVSQRLASTQFATVLGKDPSNRLAFYYSTNGTSFSSVGAAYTPTLSAWTHIAVDRDASNVMRVYANGVVIASATVAATFFNSTADLHVGNSPTNVKFPGYIDELRITNGVARYAGAFTPPTAAFPNS